MKSIKRGLAVLLAVLLMTPTLPAKVEAASVSGGNASVSGNEVVSASTSADEVLFNTGNWDFRIVNSSVSDNIIGDDYFAEDGSYTINIPEANPFFPYEVQFTYNGEVTREWFMTPDDSVEIGGHTFYVSAFFDNTVMTQMTLDVAGQKVVVYPEAKEFTNDGGGAMALSLLPLEEKSLTVDLSAFTPVELTMVSVDSIFAGENAIADAGKVIWTYAYDDDYTISASGDKLNLSYNTCYGGNTGIYYDGVYRDANRWEMIVGEADQLAADNTRYQVYVINQENQEWLIPTAYIQDAGGKRKSINLSNYYYSDYGKNGYALSMQLAGSEIGPTETAYIGLSVNPNIYENFSNFKVYEGQFATAEEAMSGKDITSQLFCTDMTKPKAGYLLERYEDNWITMVTFDANNNVTGCLSFYLYWNVSSSGISTYSMYKKVEDASYSDGYRKVYVSDTSSWDYQDGCTYRTITLYKNYPANDTYYQEFDYYKDNKSSPESVTAAYVGQYSSIAEAVAAGATDIKVDLFAMEGCKTEGYGTDYSQGVYFTIFIGEDGAENQEIFRFYYKTETGSTPANIDTLGSGTSVWFYGLRDSEGNDVPAYQVDYDMDSYAEFNYLTMFVASDVDLSKIAPMFNTSDGVNLHAEGGNKPDVSGESYHDFTNGPVHYTASAEDGVGSKNYWLQVVKATEGSGQLYINSLAEETAETKIENGVIYSTREIMLDGYHNYVHDILVANVGTEAIANLSVELKSDVLELNNYWTLSGNYELSGLNTIDSNSSYGELPNLAKVRMKAKEGTDGTDISGTLTFKSGDRTLMVLTLTGIIGDPSITTKEIPEAVLFVPYGTMIQNNNKYDWNTVSYTWIDGVLPKGMTIKPNGEIYGVPTETGEFTFTVCLVNSSYEFNDDVKTFTLTVVENTDANVDAATDEGYNLSQKVQNFAPDSTESQTLVSQGEYAEFVDIYLDGIKLVPGTDYSSEAGSTRITILNQTLVQKGLADTATHTLGVEFRTQDTEMLKRAAQNFTIGVENASGDSGNGNGNGGSSNSGNSGISSNTETAVQTISYTIQPGDTLWKIAKKYYGNGENWRKIYEDNVNVISDPNKIFVGQVIVINITSGNITTTAITAASGNTYTVQSGDNLWKIAKKVYGKGRSWRKIYEANQSVISNPDNIRVGQVFVIPE